MKTVKKFAICAGICASFLSAGIMVNAADAADNKTKVIIPRERFNFLPDVVASVGNQKITKADLIKEIEAPLANSKVPVSMITDEMLKKAVPQITSAMVDKMILLKMAEGQGIKPGPELVAKDFDKMMKTLDPKMLDNFKNQLKAQGKTLESYKAEVCQNKIAQDSLATDQWIKQNVLSKVKVSDGEVQKYYNDNKNMFKRPETVTASHILIKPEADTPEAKKAAKDKAEKLLASLVKGTADFEKLAEQESACPSGKAAKGSLGEFGRGQMIKEFEDAAFSMKPGELSKQVVETKFGYHIIKVTDKKEASTVAFEKVKNYIKGQLVNMKAKEELKRILDQEKTRLKVKINV